MGTEEQRKTAPTTISMRMERTVPATTMGASDVVPGG